MFMLGMFSSLTSNHSVLSNQESGYGRPDICIIPHDTNKFSILIELKALPKSNFEDFDKYKEKTAKTALD
jgi:hypothetical protein